MQESIALHPLSKNVCHPERSAAKLKDLLFPLLLPLPLCLSSKQNCHPERSAAKSKDLLLPF